MCVRPAFAFPANTNMDARDSEFGLRYRQCNSLYLLVLRAGSLRYILVFRADSPRYILVLRAGSPRYILVLWAGSPRYNLRAFQTPMQT